MKFILYIFIFVSLFVAPVSLSESKSFNRESSIDVQHYIIRLKFNRSKKIVYSDSSVQIKPIKDNIKIIELDAKDFKIDSILSELEGKNLEFNQTKEKVRVKLSKSYNKNELISLRFRYSIKKPKKGIHFVKPKKVKGKITRNSQIWTQGETEETSYWLPSFDFPSDKATTEQILTVDNRQTVIANGKLLSKINNRNGTTSFHYRMDTPHPLYLTSFVIGTYVKISDKYRDIPLNYYVYPNQKAIAQTAFGKTKDMLRIFEKITGVNYPYSKYDQTIVADFNFGGMENITATTYADSEILLAKYDYGKAVVEDLVSHELAHSWFGNFVTCRNWAELWLNESFATYMEASYREKNYGKSDYLRKIKENANEYFGYSAVVEKEHSLFNRSANAKNDDTMFTSVTYQKGSAVLHTLRNEIGDKSFWKAINIYLNRHKFANVETSDLQKVFEETSNRDLDWFFKQWIYGNKYPILDVTQYYNPKTKELELKIKQKQTGNKYTPLAFRIPIDIDISMSSGNKSHKIIINSRHQIFKIKIAEMPYNIEFDKGYKIPLKSISLSKLIIKK